MIGRNYSSTQRPTRSARRNQTRNDASTADTDLTFAEVKSHAQHSFPDAFAALPAGGMTLLNQTIDQNGSSQRIKIGRIRLNGVDYALSAYIRKPFTVRFSYDGGKSPLPDHIRNFELDFPFGCPLLATSGRPTDVYPEVESLIAFYLLKEGVVPTFRDSVSRTRPSLSALQRACMSILEVKEREPRARTITQQIARDTEAPNETLPAVDRLIGDGESAAQDSDGSDEGLFVPDIREMTKEKRLAYELKEAKKT